MALFHSQTRRHMISKEKLLDHFLCNVSGCCEGCPKLSYFEECVYSSISFEDMVEEHVDFIKSGYCSCNQSQERKTKVT